MENEQRNMCALQVCALCAWNQIPGLSVSAVKCAGR